jgi:hypothetical protein
MSKENIKGGRADGMTPADLAKLHGVSVDAIEKEINIGIEIEYEHTNDKSIAREISMDHIAEFPEYYSNKKYGLKAMEKHLEKANESLTLSIKKMIREQLDLILTDETPENVRFIIKYNKRNVGHMDIDANKPSMGKYTVELKELDLIKEYEELDIIKKVILNVWKHIPDAQNILILRKDGIETFWTKLGAKVLNHDYLIIQRGH